MKRLCSKDLIAMYVMVRDLCSMKIPKRSWYDTTVSIASRVMVLILGPVFLNEVTRGIVALMCKRTNHLIVLQVLLLACHDSSCCLIQRFNYCRYCAGYSRCCSLIIFIRAFEKYAANHHFLIYSHCTSPILFQSTSHKMLSALIGHSYT